MDFIYKYESELGDKPAGIVVDILNTEGIPMVTNDDIKYTPSIAIIRGEIANSVADVMGVPVYEVER